MIQVDNLSIRFPKEQSSFIFKKEYQQIFSHLSFHVNRGECLGILGESGSGKSTLGKALTQLLKPQTGTITVDGVELYKRGQKLEPGTIAIVFQDYTTSVNTRFTIESILEESFTVLKRRTRESFDNHTEAVKLLELVGLDESFLTRYPHQLSGGQLQRVCIARAIGAKPKIILFDEAISSLDAHTQVQIMDLLKSIQKEYGFTYLFITHDLPSVTYLCDRVLFLYQGQIQEIIDVQNLSQAKSDYAKKLLNSILEIHV